MYSNPNKRVEKTEPFGFEPTPDKRGDELSMQIRNSRVGGFGGSDAKMIYQIGSTGIINPAHHRRLAVYLGIEEEPNFTNDAMENGKLREQQIYDKYKELYNTEEHYLDANVCKVNAELTAETGIKCFAHIDIILMNCENNTEN